MLVAQPLAYTRLWYHEKIRGGGELGLLQNTHTPTKGIGRVFSSNGKCSCPCPFFSVCLAQTTPSKRTTSPAKKQWQRSVVRASVNVNVERSQSAPTEVNAELSLRHIMSVSSSWAWHLNSIQVLLHLSTTSITSISYLVHVGEWIFVMYSEPLGIFSKHSQPVDLVPFDQSDYPVLEFHLVV